MKHGPTVKLRHAIYALKQIATANTNDGPLIKGFAAEILVELGVPESQWSKYGLRPIHNTKKRL